MQHDIPKELKELRLNGMAGAWADLVALGDAAVTFAIGGKVQTS